MNQPEPTDRPGPPSPPDRDPATQATNRGRLPATTAAALIAGLAAAGLTWGAGEFAKGFFAPEVLADPTLGPTAGGASSEDIRRGEILDSALTYGIQGAVIGLLLGLAGATSAGRARDGVTAAGTGLVLGGLIGGLAGFGFATLHAAMIDPISDDLIVPLGCHAGIWGLIGLVGGLAFGIGCGGRSSRIAKAAIGGAVGGILAAVVYEVGGAGLLPMAQTSLPIAEKGSGRLLAHGLTGLFIALGAALAVSESRKTEARG